MEKITKLVPIYSTRNFPEYNGKLSSYQQTGNRLNNKKVMNYSQGSFNEYQNFLYNRAMYGLAVFSKEELAVMRWEKKKRIKKVQTRTKRVLNIWKQELINGIFQRFFKPKFVNTNSHFGKEFIELYQNDIDPELETSIPFTALGATKKHIISKLIQENILPKNFYELKPIYHGLPRLLKNGMDKATI